MKKKQTQKKTERKPRAEQNDLSSLNSSLGSFGLEPPKRYRPDQQISSVTEKPPVRRERLKKSESAPKTREERREQENRKRKLSKIRRKVLFYAGLAVGIVAVIIILSLTVLFKINTITIKGNEKYSNKEISAVLPISKGANLFISDTDKAEAKLEENLPYIYNAEITRKLPSTLVVNITETPTVYAIKNGDKTYTLLDGNFKVLETSAKKGKNSVVITQAALKTAVPGQSAEFTEDKIKQNLLQLSDAISRLKLDAVTGLYSTDINNNFIVYEGRITIKLGTLENLDNKLYSALTAIEKLAESNPQAEGTLTVTNEKQVYFTEK